MDSSHRLAPDVLVPRRRGSGPRVAFYSHDTQGLGHVRRNSLLAAAMVDAHPDVNVLLLSGAAEAGALPLPDRTDIVTVPGLYKDVAGRYHARSMDSSLEQVLAVRSFALESVLVNFAPDLLVVDKVPLGILGELEQGLRRVRREHGTRTVLGLRDVLDDVETTRREWRQSGSRAAIQSLYDQVWVYGDRAVFDPAEVYGWTPEVREKVRYTGYLGAGRERLLPVRSDSHGAPSVCGDIPRPFVLGPVLSPADEDFEAVEKLAHDRDDLRVHRFVGDVPALVKASSATVSMGGYNSVCELMAARRPALVVPRVVPRLEQALRAEHLARRGLVDVLGADRLEPARLTAWLRDAVAGSRRSFTGVDLQGLERVPGLALDLIDELPREGARHAG